MVGEEKGHNSVKMNCVKQSNPSRIYVPGLLRFIIPNVPI